MTNISKRLKNYLNELYIQNLINNNDYNQLYKVIDYDMYGEMNSLLFKIGVNPMKYIDIIPAHFLERVRDIYQAIIIPENVRYIGNYAFSNTPIEYIIIPDNVKICGHKIFEYCYKLKTAHIGDGLKEVPQDMFYKCKNLVRVTLGANIRVIRSGAFKHCPKLTTIHYDGNLSEFTGIYIDVDAFDRDHTINILCKNGTIKLF